MMLPLGGGVTAAQSDSPWVHLGQEFIAPADTDSASIASGTTFILPGSGVEVYVADILSPDDPASSDFPDQVIVEVPSGVGAAAVIEGIGFPVDTLDAYVEGFSSVIGPMHQLDLQDGRWFASGIYRVDADTGTMYFYISVDSGTIPGNQIIQVVVCDPDDIADAIVLMRENATIDGVPMFSGVDESAVQNIVSADVAN